MFRASLSERLCLTQRESPRFLPSKAGSAHSDSDVIFLQPRGYGILHALLLGCLPITTSLSREAGAIQRRGEGVLGRRSRHQRLAARPCKSLAEVSWFVVELSRHDSNSNCGHSRRPGTKGTKRHVTRTKWIFGAPCSAPAQQQTSP